MGNTVLQLKDVTKHYPGVVALNHVSLDVIEGEIHALVGENGAGKSTLIKTVTGAIKPTSGSIVVGGKEFQEFTPVTARENGISVIYQEFNLVNELTVYENIFLGEFLGGKAFVDKASMRKQATELFETLNIKIDANELVKNLSVGYQQMVEIAKAVSKKAKILIMDEPSAPLTNTEVDAMFRVVDTLKAQGVTIIYVSHRMEEIFRICDRVTVMRDGNLIKTMPVSETNSDELIQLMIGRELTNKYPERTQKLGGEVVLELEHVNGNGLKDISFKVHRGEILGLGGLVGAGRTELAELIFGAAQLESGKITFCGKDGISRSPQKAIDRGISLIPEDRKRHGAFLGLSVRDNISISILKRISKLTFIKSSRERGIVDKYCKALRVKTPGTWQTVGNLSGGNQQKVIFAKWIATDSELLILDEPTRGIDVGAKYEIYQIMNDLVAQGKTLIMISSEMEELIGMSDRIIVLSEGRMCGELKCSEFSQERILKMASGNEMEGRV